MNKSELIKAISVQCGIKQSEAEDALNTISYFIKKSVKSGSDLKIYGLGTFTKTKVKARVGRNPATGQAIKIPSKWKVKFRASPNFKNFIA